MIDPRLIRKADAQQLTLAKNELVRIENRIQEDVRGALADHEARMRRFTRYYASWRGRTEVPALGEEDAANFRVPITKWQVTSKWAKEHASLFGDDAEVTARPVGPDDQRRVKKIARFMTWLVFDHMRIPNKASTFNFRKVLFGRSHAYAPWTRDTYQVPLIDGSEGIDVAYEGPDFITLWPDDLIVPAEDVQSIHDFSWVVRKYRATPDELLRGEDEGRYQRITERFSDIVNFASHRRQRDFETEMVKREKDLAEGVLYEGNLSAANCLPVWEWYGKWRKLKGRRDAREDNLAGRERYESELVVRYLPDLHMIVSVQDLAQMYPRKSKRRPFVEASLVKDGSYWGPSFGELLEEIEREMNSNHHLADEAGQFSVGPVVVYKPASGFDPETFEYAPSTAIASDDPAGVRLLEMKANLEYPVMKEQILNTYAERVTGQTDMNLGRTQDRPNAPRTARQTMALLEEGDVRATLEMSALREDWGTILVHFWELFQDYGSERVFFRVTEEDADGVLDIKQGGAYMQADERNGRYDFDLKFATSTYSKEARKQNDLALYQLDLQNPLVVQNPRALWAVLDKIHRAFGDDRFSDLIPEPADMGMPVNPREEWTRMLAGETVQINPADNDQLHLLDHNRRIEDARQDPDHDPEALQTMILHAHEHIGQIGQKQLMAELTSRLVDSMKANSATGRGLMQQGMPLNLQHLHGMLGEMGAAGTAPQPGQQPQEPPQQAA